MAFDSLSERLNKAMRNVVGKGTLTDANMEDMLKEVRVALLEADVNYRIVKQFLEDVREKAGSLHQNIHRGIHSNISDYCSCSV